MTDDGICPSVWHGGAFAVHVEENGEGETGKPIVAVVGRGGDEGHAVSDLTELAYDQPFGALRVEIRLSLIHI